MTFSSCSGSTRESAVEPPVVEFHITGLAQKGAVATTPGVLSILALSARQSRKSSSEVTRMCASKSMTF